MKFNHTAHKELWNWLADNPDKNKEQWVGWKHNGGQYEHVTGSCFACEYDDKNTGSPACNNCPLVWERDYCQDNLSVYSKWRKSLNDHNHIKCSKLARQIANLPVREGVECE